VNAHEVKPVRLIQSLCTVCGSNLAGLTLLYIGLVLPCVAAVVSRPAWRMLVGLLLIARYVSNSINGHLLLFIIPFLANVILTFTFAICYRGSVCLSVVRLSSVTLMRRTQPVEIFGNVSSPYDSPGTLVFGRQKLLMGTPLSP